MPAPWIGLTAAFDSSGTSRGEELAPEAFAAVGLLERLGIAETRDVDARLTDSTRDPASGIIGYRRVLEVTRNVESAVTKVYEDGARPFLVGGDCGCIIGAFVAARDRYRRLGACFLDAHLDSWDGVTSPSGELADMDIGVVTGRAVSNLFELRGGDPVCHPGDVIVVGYRLADDGDLLGPETEHLLADPRIQIIPAEVVLHHDAAEIGIYAAERLASQTEGFWLHFDVDCFDRRVMPAVTYGQDFGLAYEHVEALLASLFASSALVGASLCDFTPNRDPDGVHASRIVDTIARAWPSTTGT